jgi:hypothetical protein
MKAVSQRGDSSEPLKILIRDPPLGSEEHRG